VLAVVCSREVEQKVLLERVLLAKGAADELEGALCDGGIKLIEKLQHAASL
jgi:hypothetical protein